jgi:hypothetical protein
VTQGSITLQQGVTVAPGQTLSFAVNIGPTPVASDVTITLTSSDTTKVTVTPSIIIPAGATTSTSPAQVTGVNFGSSTITASATGFVGASQSVSVGANLSFSPTTATVGTGGTTNLTLTLSAPAPANGVTVTLASDATNFATVPPSVTIAQGQTTATVTVTGVAVGTAHITTSSSVANLANASATVSVIAGLAISSAPLPSGVVGSAYSASDLASGGIAPYTYSATGLPAGLSINATSGVISGTPTTATGGAVPVTITATDSTNPTHLTVSTTGLTITITSGLTIASAALPNGVVGTAYTASETVSGGTQPYTYSATGLPGGLSINTSTGVISGTPTTATATPAAVTITVTDSTSPTHLTASTTGLTINITTGLTITNTALPNGMVGTAYTASETGNGGVSPLTYSATGLPAGLSINATSGAISGTPTTATSGAVPVTITVTDSTTPTHQTASTTGLTINIIGQLTISSTALPNGVVGTAYTAPAETVNGGTAPLTYSATGLPAGLSINTTTGVISGTPTAATGGAVPVTITVTDSTTPTHLTASTTGLTINITSGLTITNNALPNGVVGTAYTTSETGNGGTSPLTYSATGLPGGLSINSTSGQISGTPTTATGGPVPVTITVTDATTPTHQTASTTGLTINIIGQLTITSNPLPSGVVGTAYTASETVNGGTSPLTYSATGLPAGLSINTGTGQISGTPTTATGGAAPVTITVTDSTTPTHQTASTTGLSITITSPQLTITSNPLPSGVAGTAYSASETAGGGTAPLTYSATGLPGGLSIDPGTGLISGTPTAATAGAVPVTITVTDSTTPTHQTASTTGLTITIAPTPLTISNTALPGGVVGTAYTASETGNGGTAPLTYSATGLPAGLSINSGTGAISGTPTTATGGAVPVTITVTDSTTPTHLTASTTGLTITIAPSPLTISNTALSSGTVGTAYSASEAASGGTKPYTYSASGLPGGLSINPGTGAISGTPTTATAGAVPVTITATDSTTPTHLTASTIGLTITISPAPLTITTQSPLANGAENMPYSQTVAAMGGTQPYTWSASGLPPVLTINTVSGLIGGTPSSGSMGTYIVTVTVKDSSTPQLSTSTPLSLTINPGNQNFLTVSGGTVGQNLQLPLTVTLSSGSSGSPVTISSSNPGVVTLAARPTDAGSGQISITPGLGTTTFQVFAFGVANSGSSTITAHTANYVDGTSPITAAPSAFVLAGPNGTGGSFTTGPLSATQLTISAVPLDSSGNPGSPQALAGAQSAVVTLSVGTSALGTVAPTSIAFTGGQNNLGAQFNAGTTAVSSTITANEPAGFSTPAGSANVLSVTISVQNLQCTAVTVGQNFENQTTCALNGPASSDTIVTLTSNDPTKLLLAVNATDPGSISISRTIRTGGTSTPPFYVYGVGNTGQTSFGATAGGLTGTGTVTLAKSGFVLISPFGLGANFPATAGGAPIGITVQTALLDASGNYLDTQAVAGGISASVAVTSSNTSVGTVTSPAVITGANNTATVQFQALSGGTTVLTAVAPGGYTTPASFASVTATVGQPRILIDDGNTIGKNLERIGTIILLGAPAPAGGLQVTLQATGSLLLSSSANGDDAGNSTVVVTIPGGGTSGTYYMYALDSFGTATVAATAAGFKSGSGTETLTPSGIVIQGPGGQSGLIPFNTPLSGGDKPLSILTAQLDASGNFVQAQPLAGTASLTILTSNSNSATGTVSSTATILPGNTANGTTTVQFHPVAVGSTTITAAQPFGYTVPADGTGSLKINVQ